jgi:hypothetical protein
VASPSSIASRSGGATSSRSRYGRPFHSASQAEQASGGGVHQLHAPVPADHEQSGRQAVDDAGAELFGCRDPQDERALLRPELGDTCPAAPRTGRGDAPPRRRACRRDARATAMKRSTAMASTATSIAIAMVRLNSVKTDDPMTRDQ